MSALLAAAEAQPMTWPDVIALALFLAFIFGVLWLLMRWLL